MESTVIDQMYMVQYRRIGSKTWIDSHCETFKRKPSGKNATREFLESAAEAVASYDRRGQPLVKGDFEVRVIKRRILETSEVVGETLRFKKREVVDGIRSLWEAWGC